MSEQKTVLKKEFKKADVQRMRNLLTGNQGDRTQVQAGYEKQIVDHKEGDIWEEGGKTWTIKNGIKQTMTKMDEIKKLAFLPICCPKCKEPMKTDIANKKMYKIHQMCLNCVIDMEAEVKKTGNWDEYAKNQQIANRNFDLEQIEAAIDSWYKEKEVFITEAGDVEEWQGGDKTEMYQKIKEELAKAKAQDIY
jgi:hypothetical protein